MIINEAHCDSFAGMTDKTVAFEEGLNLVIGDNETGKTTIADLIRCTLLQTATVGRQSKGDKAFRSTYYPSHTEGFGGEPDGEVSFSIDGEKYILRKEWGDKGAAAVLLRAPDGTRIRNEELVEARLSELLAYGKGTYDEAVFSSQRHPFAAIETMMEKDSADSQKNLSVAIAQAVMEVGGFDSRAFQMAVTKRIDDLGKNWDEEQDCPKMRKGGARWNIAANSSSVLSAYYDYLDAQQSLDEIQTISDEYDRAEKALKKASEDCTRNRREQQEFAKVKYAITDRKHRNDAVVNARDAVNVAEGAYEGQKKKVENAQRDRDKVKSIGNQWPGLEVLVQRIENLLAERKQAETRDALLGRRDGIRELQDNLLRKSEQIDDNAPSEEQVAAAKRLNDAVATAKSQLAGLNIDARASGESQSSLLVTACSDGREVPVVDGRFEITESVDISIPGVLALRLSPKGIDVDMLSREIEENTRRLHKQFETYGVSDIPSLESRAREAQEAEGEYTEARRHLDECLDGDSLESIEQELAGIDSSTRGVKEIEGLLSHYCKGQDPKVYLGNLGNTLDRLRKKFGTAESMPSIMAKYEEALKEEIDKLKERGQDVVDAERKLEKAKQELEAVPQDGGRFADVEDPEAFESDLVEKGGELSEIEGNARTKLGWLQSRMESVDEEAAREKVDRCERTFVERKAEYRRWIRILKVFEEIQQDDDASPIGGIATRFQGYLQDIAGGHIAVGSLSDSLDAKITSGRSALSWALASDGTKDTLSLAFRLAVIDSLFPQGGGLIVLDDPFTDMDPQRTAKACSMVEDFAERHQVIFMTCDPKYKNIFINANNIEWS